MVEVKRVEVPAIDWEFFVKLDKGDWVGYKLEKKEIRRFRCEHCDSMRVFVMPEGATVFHFSCGACKGENQAPLLELMTREEFEKAEAELETQIDELLVKHNELLEKVKEVRKLCSHRSSVPDLYADEAENCISCGAKIDER